MSRMQSVVDVHVLFKNDNNEYLFIQRANTGHRDGQYSLVAGHLEPGESIEECAIRESKEEAGVSIAPGSLDFKLVMRRDSEQNRISFFLTCRSWEGTLVNMEPHKCSAFVWAPLDHPPEPTVDYIAHALENIRNGVILADFKP
ncbi:MULTISPECIES: NUDIX domain-containing protein [unclassified Caballeronia]|uniref:NUDIX hydrolase n=1 Tax=unclassified Caballeronia TaxID=2646786 RepID=UPI0028632538|nr:MULTISPECIES: NUDIX domain-containing protein [unclassified Caballeronia]MDR5774015.1 NUDIX domain-containing protein [Caballeronia sp. LZ002]MDR5849450.1 NUDIX domain-containing protein [Caballeronia sp. LZ003]